jgi:hypothetical protein
MRSMICEDGRRRILAKVLVPMGREEITLFALSNIRFMGDDDAMNNFERLNKRELFATAKDTVSFFGDSASGAADRINVTWTERQVQRARAHVDRLFPEVD